MRKRWIFSYVFLFSFLWRYLVLVIFQIHPLQDLIQIDTIFDGPLTFTFGCISFLLASICVVLASIFKSLNGRVGTMDTPSVLWAIGAVLLHGGIILPLLFLLIWRVWPSDNFMVSQLYLTWVPAAIIGPGLWWFLLKNFKGKATIPSRDDVIDDELAGRRR